MRQAAKRTTVITAATSLGFAVVQLDGSILNVALPRIGAALGASVDTLQWTVDAYFLVFAALLLSAGALGDRIGSKRAFIAGFTIFAVASCACGLATTPLALIAFRAMQGVGGALLVPCSLALINHACADDTAARARAIGTWTAAGGVALAVGPVISGLLLSTLGWRSIFLANLPIAGFGIWLAARFAVETDRPAIRRGIDPAGQILAIIFLIALVWAVIEAGSFGLTAPRVIVGFIVAALAACLLLVVERHAKDPAIPLSFFQDTTFSAATFGGFVVSVVLFGLAFGMTLYFQRMLSYTPAEAGLAFVPFAIGITVSNLTGGWLSAKAGARLPIVSGLLLAAAGAMLLTGLGPDTAYLSMLPAQLMVRFGAGLAMPPMTAALLSTVPRARSGSASGLLNAIRQSGAAIGIALYGALMRGNMIEGLRIAVVISAVLFAAAATAAVFGIRARDPGVSLTGREVKAN
ncbi:MFS transporter [Acidisphaera sp. S103]|uniref:MFS transporter n=1 Tax=Acidisphaera sp. S103 TaxID=1747223 RepID=UPI00131A85AB|nr:MFS transporter [Acidisphaera sp. S103]